MAADVPSNAPEIIESQSGDALAARMNGLANASGLGPVDTCILYKAAVRPLGKPTTERVGYYHFVIGVDTSGPASVGAYFHQLINNQEPLGWLPRVSWRIESGVYCCHNAFNHTDTHVTVTVPGGVEASMIDMHGNSYPMTDEAWAQTYVSAVLRALAPLPSKRPVKIAENLQSCFRRFKIFTTAAAETEFLNAVKTVFWQGTVLGCEDTTMDPTPFNNRLVHAVYGYLEDRARHQDIVDLFQPLSERDASLLSYVALAMHALGRTKEAVELCASAITRHQSGDTALLRPAGIAMAQSEILTSLNMLPPALTLARRAVEWEPTQSTSWLYLARHYAVCAMPRNCLIALNAAPLSAVSPPLLPAFPLDGNITTTTGLPNDVQAAEDLELPQRGEVDLNRSTDSVLAAEPSPLERELAGLPGNQLVGQQLISYSILATLVGAIGWEALLVARSAVFVLEIEDHRPPTHHHRKTDSSGLDLTQGSQPPFPAAGAPAAVEREEDTSLSKRHCERWLDNQFHALYRDIKTLAVHASHPPASSSPAVHCLLGDLALRLQRPDQAEKAYRRAINAGWSHKAWLALLRLFVRGDRTREVLEAADNLLQFYDQRRYVPGYGHVGVAIFEVISRHGLTHVRSAQLAVQTTLGRELHPVVSSCFQEAVRCRITGFDT